jgi:SAM-dependent methyltransferase
MQNICLKTAAVKIANARLASSILDLGCSTNGFPIATHYLDYIDHSALYSGKEFIVHDINLQSRLPFDDKCFDFVYCSHVLEHVDDPQGLLLEMSRIGKAGFVVVPTKLEDNLYSQDAVKCGERYLTDRFGHKWWFDYGRDAILTISPRVRVTRQIPQSEREITQLKTFMPNLFELAIYWVDEILWSFDPNTSPAPITPIRVGVSDLPTLPRSLLRAIDAYRDFRKRRYIRNIRMNSIDKRKS